MKNLLRMNLCWLLLVASSLALPSPAATIWDGPTISFTQGAPYSDPPPDPPIDRDQLTPSVALTRATPTGGGTGGMFNAVTETSFAKFVSPAGTAWAVGSLTNYDALTYTDWTSVAGGHPVGNLVGQNLVVHLISDDIYLSIKFTALSSTGGFSYIRSTPSVANNPPSISITNPVTGSIIPAIAPSPSALVTISAAASDSDGTVTNVQFFDGATILGNVAASPFSVAVALSVGSHSLTAIATDNSGATNVSAVVNVTVVSNTLPVVTLLAPTNNPTYTAPATVIIAASATSSTSVITNVQFFDGGALLGQIGSVPFSVLTNLSVGTHSVKAVATDALGTTNASAAVSVTVLSTNTVVSQPRFISLALSNKSPSAPLTSAQVPVVTNGLATLRWTSDAGGKVDLLYTTNLADPLTWYLAQPNIIGSTTGTNVLSDPPYLAGPAYRSNTNLFYRLSAAPPQSPGLAIRLQVVATNFVSPTVLTHAHDGSGRLFIADQTGQIRIVDNTGALLPTPFLDISNRMVTLTTGYDERGLLGLAFHPDYPNNGKFYVYYSAPSPTTNFNNICVLSEFKVATNNANLADTNSERILLTINEPEFNHEGADIVFGPDGYLYLGPGDGGGAGDQHGANGNAQLLTTLLGKILRIDVDHGSPYAIPSDNPFVNTPGALPEIYAYGLRNPWRFSFDRGGTHQGFIADVGQNLYEEIDLLRKGANYGWRIIEGHHAFAYNTATALNVNVAGLDYPIHEYPHGTAGISVIGGYVYRGTNYASLVGQYVFGDFSTSFGVPDGQLYYLSQTRPGIWERFSFQLWPNNGRLGRFIKGFGEDEAGEIYVLSTTILGPNGRSGDVRRLVQP